MPAQVEAAVALLRSSGADALTEAEAHWVAAHMRLVSYPAGATVIREGDQVHTGYMLLLLEGEVLVETDGEGAGGRSLGARPRNFVGEMALLDGEPRSAEISRPPRRSRLRACRAMRSTCCCATTRWSARS